MKILLTIACLLTCLGSRAAEPDKSQPSCNSVMVGVGYTNQYDTYLTPLEYTGPQLDILYLHERTLKRNSRVSYQSLLDVQMHTASTDVSSIRMYGADIHFDAGWHYNWNEVLTKRLCLKAGGLVGGTLGGTYIDRSGNNPANARAAVRLSASVGAQYVLPLRRTQLTFRYSADIPLMGAAFSPDYEQSYYELSEYGYCHNICFTNPANAFSIRQMAIIGIQLKRGTLSVGYKADIRQAKLNNLRQHQYAHSFMIGWAKNL